MHLGDSIVECRLPIHTPLVHLLSAVWSVQIEGRGWRGVMKWYERGGYRILPSKSNGGVRYISKTSGRDMKWYRSIYEMEGKSSKPFQTRYWSLSDKKTYILIYRPLRLSAGASMLSESRTSFWSGPPYRSSEYATLGHLGETWRATEG
jgi:hypothetical protein